MRLMNMRKVLLVGAFTAWVISAVQPARSEVDKTPLEDAVGEAPGLVQAGRYDEALWAYDGSGYKMGEELLRQVAGAKDRGATEEAVRLYEAYFHYFPFGPLYWDQKWKGWSEAAFDYIELRRTSVQAAGGEELAQDIAAMEPYRRLMQSYEKREFNTCKQLADEIVEKYPLSLFCPAAVLSVCDLSQGRSPPPAPVVATYEAYLARMKEAGSPKRSQILVMLDYVPSSIVYGKGEQDQRKGLSEYLEIVSLTDITYEKSYYALQAAQVGLTIAKEDSLELSRKLFLKFLAKHPGAGHAYQARRGLVKSYVIANQSEQAEKVLRALDLTAPADTDLSEEFLTVAQGYFGAGEHDKSLLLLQELLERFPESGSAPTAYLRLGELYEALGEEEQVLATYKKLADLTLSYPDIRLRHADTYNRAVRFLGDHYMQKQDWAEALKWWEAWTPSSWCGTCLEGMKDQRARNIATCQAKMGRVEEVFSTLERPPLSEWSAHYGPDILISLVDFYRYRDELDALEEKLKGALAESEHATAVKTALEYIELLRMADNKDVEGLWEFLSWFQGHPFPPESLYWKSREAANLLVCMPAETKPFAMAKLSERSGAKYWGPALLARMGAVEILPVLKERMSDEENVHILADYFYALALLGTDESYAIIKEYAEQGTGNHRTAAQNVLKSYPPPNAQAQNDG